MTLAATDVELVDLADTPLRELNQRLHDLDSGEPLPRQWRIGRVDADAFDATADADRQGVRAEVVRKPEIQGVVRLGPFAEHAESLARVAAASRGSRSWTRTIGSCRLRCASPERLKS